MKTLLLFKLISNDDDDLDDNGWIQAKNPKNKIVINLGRQKLLQAIDNGGSRSFVSSGFLANGGPRTFKE